MGIYYNIAQLSDCVSLTIELGWCVCVCVRVCDDQAVHTGSDYVCFGLALLYCVYATTAHFKVEDLV